MPEPQQPILQFLLPAVLALVGGLAGSLIAPLVHWSVEKRRGKAEYRRKMIERWRQAIAQHDFHKRWSSVEPFGETPEYAELREYLEPGFRRSLETGRVAFVGQDGR